MLVWPPIWQWHSASLLLVTQVLLSACNAPEARPNAQDSQIVSAGGVSYCEFGLRDPPPTALPPIATRRVPTEGEERVFYDYMACGGRVPVSIELSGSVVASIEIHGQGNCFEDVSCVGETYATAAQHFPNARLFISSIEGATFSMPIREGVTLVFDPMSLEEQCFDRPEQCDAAIHRSRVVSIYLYSPWGE